MRLCDDNNVVGLHLILIYKCKLLDIHVDMLFLKIISYEFPGEDSNSMSIRTRKTRSQVEEGTNDTWNWEEVLKKNPDACKAVVDAEEEEEKIQKAERQAKEVNKYKIFLSCLLLVSNLCFVPNRVKTLNCL